MNARYQTMENQQRTSANKNSKQVNRFVTTVGFLIAFLA
ncbi:hypothetical protein JOD43_003633 [Pullulanibacillus pueri]|nr:hypothetical protein [Pullulanibacillus pueri]